MDQAYYNFEWAYLIMEIDFRTIPLPRLPVILAICIKIHCVAAWLRRHRDLLERALAIMGREYEITVCCSPVSTLWLSYLRENKYICLSC